MAKEKNKKSILKAVRNILIGIVVFLIVFYLGVRAYFRLPVGKYYFDSDKAFRMPGLSEGLILQGISYDAIGEKFFVTGYMNDHSATPIYIVDEGTKRSIKKVLLKDAEGRDYCSHCGGLSVSGDYVYVAGSRDCNLVVYSYDDIMHAEDGAYVTALGTFEVGGNLSVAYTTIVDNCIIVGEFYREGNYKTDETHKMTTTGGDYNQAIAVAYKLSDSEDSIFGICPKPIACYSITDQVQGMAFNDEKVYLSTSYGAAFSKIFVYNLDEADNGKSYVFNDVSVPLYELDSKAVSYVEKIAPMSEEIEFVNGKMYTMCESATKKYIFGKFTSAYWCYATRME